MVLQLLFELEGGGAGVVIQKSVVLGLCGHFDTFKSHGFLGSFSVQSHLIFDLEGRCGCWLKTPVFR